MKAIKFCIISILVLMVFLTAVFPAGTALAQDDRTASVIPTLKAPVGTIVTKKPTFTWTKVTSATNYQYQVWKGTTKFVDKTILSSACGTSTCSQTPTITLGYDVFKWRARAKLAGVWKAWSAYKFFTVSAPAFSSGFANTTAGWKLLPDATYWHTTSTTLYTNGYGTRFVSAYKDNAKYFDFDYSARIKCSGDPYGVNMGIHFRSGSNIAPVSWQWYPGYAFQVHQDRQYRFVKFDNSGNTVDIQPWTDLPELISIADWNEYRVVAYGDTFLLYFNDTLILVASDSSYSGGNVGVSLGYYGYGDHLPVFSVDWAKLSVITKLSDRPAEAR